MLFYAIHLNCNMIFCTKTCPTVSVTPLKRYNALNHALNPLEWLVEFLVQGRKEFQFDFKSFALATAVVDTWNSCAVFLLLQEPGTQVNSCNFFLCMQSFIFSFVSIISLDKSSRFKIYHQNLKYQLTEYL